jgi:hypothetical protein
LRLGQPAVISATEERRAILPFLGSAEINPSCLLSILDATAFSLGSHWPADRQRCFKFMCRAIVHTKDRNIYNFTKTGFSGDKNIVSFCVFCYRDFVEK